jgi:Skp family chaperone for outer membrane proteins
MQAEINAKQTALIQLVQAQTAQATQNIAAAVSRVSKEKGLDVVVDGAAVFAGGEKLVNNGEDITEAIVKTLSPQLNRPSAPSATAPKAQ